MKSQEALKLAFEKVTGIPDAWTNPALMQARNGFIQGWEASLSQMPQEPVAYSGNGTAGREADVRPTGFFFQMPKPVTQPEPPQRKPLTIGDVKIIWQNLDVREGVIMGLVRAVEAAHDIKENT